MSDAVEGHKLSKITLTVTDNKIVPSGAKIIDKNKKDVTGNYDISYVDGALTTKKTISAKVTFKVVNGSWDDGTAADKTVTLKGNEGDTLKLAAKDIPSVGSKPNTGYKAGGWDVIPSTDTAITKDTTYKYTYANGGVDPSPEPTTETTPAPTKTAEPTPEPTVTQEPITIPKTPSGVKATAKKEKVTVTWNKIKKTKKTKALRAQIKSIQVQYATDASFTQNVGTKTVGKGKTKTTIKLERKTVYYVRVRYVGADGVSAWSKVKRVKTK